MILLTSAIAGILFGCLFDLLMMAITPKGKHA